MLCELVTTFVNKFELKEVFIQLAQKSKNGHQAQFDWLI